MIQPEKTSKYAVVVSLLTLCFIACNGKASEISNHSSNPIVTIERFDKGLPSYVQETDSAQIFLFIDKYTPFFPVYCRHILGLGDAPSFQKGLKMFLSNEAISQLYADTETKFSNDTVWITELQNAFLRYNEAFLRSWRSRVENARTCFVCWDDCSSLTFAITLSPFSLKHFKVMNCLRGKIRS